MLRLRLLTGRFRFWALVVIASRRGRLVIWWIRGSVGSTRARTRLWSRRLLSASSATTMRLTSSSILPERDLFPKSTLLSREFFHFQKSWRARLAIWNVSGRDYRFVAQNGLISVC